MRKIIYQYVLIFVLFHVAFPKENIAILDLNSNTLSKHEMAPITDKFRYEIFNTNTYNVLERARMDEILTEQGFQLTGCTNNECAVEAGKILNVRYILIGNVNMIGDMYSIIIRIVDVETSEIKKSEEVNCSDCSLNTFYISSIKEIAQKLAGKYIYSQDSFKSKLNKSTKIQGFSNALDKSDGMIGIGWEGNSIIDGLNFAFYLFEPRIFLRFSYVFVHDAGIYYDPNSGNEKFDITGMGFSLGYIFYSNNYFASSLAFNAYAFKTNENLDNYDLTYNNKKSSHLLDGENYGLSLNTNFFIPPTKSVSLGAFFSYGFNGIYLFGLEFGILK